MIRGALGAILLAVTFGVSPAMADDGTHVHGGDGAWDVDIQKSDDEAINGLGSATSNPEDSPYVDIEVLAHCDHDPTLRDSYGCSEAAQCGGNGTAWVSYGVLPSGEREDLGSFCDEPGDAAPDAPGLTLAVIAQAFRQVPLPASTISIQPPGGKTLVNLPTILSTDAAAFTESVTLLGQSVTLDITPVSYRWVHGDGTEQTSDWAGVRYAKRRPMGAYLSHTYLRADHGLPARVDTTWSARFSVNGGPWQPVPDTVTIEGAPVDLEVVEASPILVGYE
jgi:hypothetical protein